MGLGVGWVGLDWAGVQRFHIKLFFGKIGVGGVGGVQQGVQRAPSPPQEVERRARSALIF